MFETVQPGGAAVPLMLLPRQAFNSGAEWHAAANDGRLVVKKLPPRSPNLNAFIERFIQTLKHECLGHFVILGQKHLDYLAAAFVEYYHTHRPHQAMENKPLLRLTDADPGGHGEVACEERLGGLLKHYYRKAA